MTEDEAYEKIDKEINGGELVRSVWTRAYADSDGDESKAKARYIKDRFSQIMLKQKSINNLEVQVKNLKFGIYDRKLTDSDNKKLAILKKAAWEDFGKIDDTLPFAMAGHSLSDGGAIKIADFLQKALDTLRDAVEKIPEDLNRNTDYKLFVDLSIACQYYLFVDMYRHRTPALVFGKQREAGKQRDELMDRIAFSATNYLELAEYWLNAKK